ncbi:MAG: FtsX-like permease family protein [Limnobacter sp.]|nr:FtsX-like permease family protein [Limnobacter sp.]
MFVLKFWMWQSRRASLRLLFVALTLAVAAIASVGVFSARLEAALVRDATQMLGGDVVVESRRDVSDASWAGVLKQPQYAALKQASSVEFPTVIPSERTDLLVSMKAVGQTYPLVGRLRVKLGNGPEQEVAHGPAPGEVWVDQGVPEALGVQPGQWIAVGESRLLLTGIVLAEPDRGMGFLNFSPRAMIHLGDLPATGLVGLGSRAKWRVYVSGPTRLIAQFNAAIKPLLNATEELETLDGDRPQVGRALQRAQDFLAMAALIGTLVACVGIALVAHLYSKEQAHELAILKSLGFKPRSLLRLWLYGLGLLTVLAGVLGVAIGWLAHWGLMALLADLVGVSLPMAGLVYFTSRHWVGGFAACRVCGGAYRFCAGSSGHCGYSRSAPQGR